MCTQPVWAIVLITPVRGVGCHAATGDYVWYYTTVTGEVTTYDRNNFFLSFVLSSLSKLISRVIIVIHVPECDWMQQKIAFHSLNGLNLYSHVCTLCSAHVIIRKCTWVFISEIDNISYSEIRVYKVLLTKLLRRSHYFLDGN